MRLLHNKYIYTDDAMLYIYGMYKVFFHSNLSMADTDMERWAVWIKCSIMRRVLLDCDIKHYIFMTEEASFPNLLLFIRSLTLCGGGSVRFD